MPLRDKLVKFRATADEITSLKQEAAKYGYELSSYVRYRIFGKREGLRIIRRPSVEMNMLGDALGQLGQTTSELNKIGSNLNQIAKRLNQGSRDAFGLDGCLRQFEQLCHELRKILHLIKAAITGRPTSHAADKTREE